MKFHNSIPKMRNLLLVCVITLLVLSSPTSTTAEEDVETVEIKVNALIDGLDYLHIKNNDIWFHHVIAQLPGTFDGADQPTHINDFEWYPYFQYEDARDQLSGVSTDIVSIPAYDLIYTLMNISVTNFDSQDPVVPRGTFQVTIETQPSTSNDYELVIKLDDEDQIAAAWMEFTIWAEYNVVDGTLTTQSNVNPETQEQTVTYIVEEESTTTMYTTNPTISLVGPDFLAVFMQLYLGLTIILAAIKYHERNA